MAEFVFFWNAEEENGIFSNWYPAGFIIEGVHYAHVEQYMMAKKALCFGDLASYAGIMASADPKRCKELGRGVAHFDSGRWSLVREGVMTNALKAKAEQNPDVLKKLMSTGDNVMAEASPTDKIWGIGVRAEDPRAQNPAYWEGQNLMGKVWMRVRAHFQEREQ